MEDLPTPRLSDQQGDVAGDGVVERGQAAPGGGSGLDAVQPEIAVNGDFCGQSIDAEIGFVDDQQGCNVLQLSARQ